MTPDLGGDGSTGEVSRCEDPPCFLAPIGLVAAAGATAIDAGDVDLDGHSDIVVAAETAIAWR